MVSIVDANAKVTRAILNMDRLNQFVHGPSNGYVVTDGGTIKTLAHIAADAAMAIGNLAAPSFNTSISVTPQNAQMAEVVYTMTPSQRQVYRDALSAVDDLSDVAIGSRREWMNQNDPIGQFIGNALFGSTTDGQLASLVETARQATVSSFSYNLVPMSLGGVLTDA